jgi:hypothetical protein
MVGHVFLLARRDVKQVFTQSTVRYSSLPRSSDGRSAHQGHQSASQAPGGRSRTRTGARGKAPDPFGREEFAGGSLEPPFYGIHVRGALFHTRGGLKVDGKARVLRPDGSASYPGSTPVGAQRPG